MTRQVVLDTETTGMEAEKGHRIIEVGAVEVERRRYTGRQFHYYLNPDREVDAGAYEVHGLGSDFLADKPRFEEIATELLDFLRGAELIIHNAPFDVGFLDAEFARLGSEWGRVTDHATIFDTLPYARQRHPGQRNSLDALCGRYGIDNSNRDLHGALLDAEILADVYLAMTGGQTALSLGESAEEGGEAANTIRRLPADRPVLPGIAISAEERSAHAERLAALEAAAGSRPPWPGEESAG